MAKALRNSKSNPDNAFASFLQYSEFLGTILIIQIIVAIWSATYFEGVITVWAAVLYMFMWVAPLVVYGINVKQLDTPSMPSAVSPRSWISRGFRYIFFFSIGLALFSTLVFFGAIKQGSVFAPYAWSVFIFHFVIVAPSETILFQGILPNRARSWIARQNSKLIKNWGDIITYSSTQMLFAIAHIATYGANIALLVSAFIFGMIFLWLAETWGLASAMGIHSAWNLTLIGAIGGVSTQQIIPMAGGIILVIIPIIIIFIAVRRIKNGHKFAFPFNFRKERSVA